MLKDQKEILNTLKYMLEALVDCHDSFTCDAEEVELYDQGVRALKAAIDAVECQVYA